MGNPLTKEKAEKIKTAEAQVDIDKILKKFYSLCGIKEDDSFYQRRRDKIFKLLKDVFMMTNNKKKLIIGADLYQKVESFMTYQETSLSDGTKAITTDIETLIGEVLKGLYISFLLHFLDDSEELFPIPYFGKLRIKEINRFNPLHKKNIHYFYGRLYLDEGLRKDLQAIYRNDQIDILDSALKDTKKILEEKINQ